MVRLSHTFLSLAVAAAAHCATVSQQWSLTAENIAPDGFTRSAEVVNGVFPGPLLTANQGDSITIDVTNSLFDPTMRRSTSIVSKMRSIFLYGLKC
jgi:iron transport multicopper oxidase